MGRPLSQSLMALAYSQITNAPGSPYLKVRCQLRAGGVIYNPMGCTRIAMDMDFKTNFATQMQIHLVIPQGDLMEYITPYIDDLEVTVIISSANEQGGVGDEVPLLSRTYRAHIEDQTRNPIEFGTNAGLNDVEMENLSNLTITAFRLEEVGVELLRLIRVGTTLRGNVPAEVATALLSAYANSIQLDNGEKITGPTVETGYNDVPRNNIPIPDGTPLMSVPDLLQNDEGGIYQDALGFFVHLNHIYLWPLYKLDRGDVAKRSLRVYLSPDPKARIPEQSWRISDDSPDIVEVWIGKDIKVDDQSQGQIHQYGTGVRNVDPASILGDGGRVEGNRVFKDASKTVMSFQNTELVTGRNIINTHEATTNPIRLASRLAKAKGITVNVVWHHSLPSLILPAMAVELVYDYQGEIRTLEGTLLQSYSVIDAVGKGFNTRVSRSLTVLSLFVPRHDKLFTKWVDEEGAIGKSTVPTRDSIFT